MQHGYMNAQALMYHLEIIKENKILASFLTLIQRESGECRRGHE
jgi:hypothetical protein